MSTSAVNDSLGTRPRVAVTGVGVVCAIGNSTEEFWASALRGDCGIRQVQSLDVSAFDCRIAGEVRNFDPSTFLSADEVERDDRAAHLALSAAREAVEQGGLAVGTVDPYRIGVILGKCQGTPGDDNTPPQMMHATTDAVAHHVGAQGPRIVISTACAAGSNAIGLGADKLRDGEVDVVLAGGTDMLWHLTFSGFSGLQSLSPEPCAPYSRSAGLNLGEGAAILLLERLDDAVARGANVICEVVGYGLSADAYHATAPDPTGRGPLAAVRRALDQAGIDAEAVGYVNGHGTGTPANDRMERKIMRLLFGDRAVKVPISSTKSLIGHTLGASGAIEAAACALAVERDEVPPTANVAEDYTEPEFDFVPNIGRPAVIDVALSNNYAFGGNNASLVFAKTGVAPSRPAGIDRDVVVSGIGAVGALGVGVGAWWDALRQGRSGVAPITRFDSSRYRHRQAAELPDLDGKQYAPPNAWRHMDGLARQSLAAARLALSDAGMNPSKAEKENIGLFFATGSGPLQTARDYMRSYEADPNHPNVMLFPSTTVNAAPGHVSIVLGLRGPTTTLSTGSVSAHAALLYATDLVRRGDVDAMVVVASDEFSEHLLSSADGSSELAEGPVRPFDEQAAGTALGAASVAFVVESADRAAARAASPYCQVLGGAMTSDLCDREGLDPSGDAFVRALELATERSGITLDQIDYCVAAASGSRAPDRAEARALARAFGDIAVTAPKAATGECGAASGAANVLLAALALRHQTVTPTANLVTPLADVPGAVLGSDREQQLDFCVANATAPGGNYAAVVLGALKDGRHSLEGASQ